MEKSELVKRAEDLARRCDRTGNVTCTKFLSPAERYEIENGISKNFDCTMLATGGENDCERTALFFIPCFIDTEDFDPSCFIRAVKIEAYFGSPGHRDYLGALMAMGVSREWLGDIRIIDSTAYVFCFESILEHLLTMDKVGRCGVKVKEVPLPEVPDEHKIIKEISFSVMSLRLDAVLAGMFNMSRTEAVKHISAGNVSVNYSQTEKTDTSVGPGDIISIRGVGKGTVTGTGGTSRRGRTFVYAQIFK